VTSTRATLVLAVALVLAAAAFDTPSLYVPGIALLLALPVGRLWAWQAARRVRLVHRPGPRAVIEGQPYSLEIVVDTDGLPLPGGVVTHPLASSPARLSARSAPPVTLEVRSPRRGWWQIEPVTLRVTDPLRLTAAEVLTLDSDRVLVLPRVEPVVLAGGALHGTDHGNVEGPGGPRGAGHGKRSIEFEMDGLRSYRHGSPASRIHWPILARTGELVERRLVGGANSSPVVVLDAEHPADLGALDRAVRAAASLCVHLAPSAGCILLLPGDRTPHRIDPELRAWPRAHARLAVVEGGGRPPDPRSASLKTAVFWVTAGTETPRIAPELAAGTCYLVTPSSLPSEDPVFTVAGCEGHRLGAVMRGAAERARAA
jgi:uncharacterized protein (DUF58 family)